jgi:hypothetical protein
MQPPSVPGGSLAEEFLDGVSEDGRFVRWARGPVQVHEEAKRRIGWQILAPTHDEVFRSRVQIALAEGGRIDGVEQLSQLGNAHLDDFAFLGDRITGRSAFRSHFATPGQPGLRAGQVGFAHTDAFFAQLVSPERPANASAVSASALPSPLSL